MSLRFLTTQIAIAARPSQLTGPRSSPVGWLARRWSLVFALCLACGLLTLQASQLKAQEGRFAIATFSADVTIPLNHRCMGILPVKSQKIVDPLYAHGLVLLGETRPLVFCAVDWCEIRNGAYDQWRDALADAAGTTRERVLVTSLHQHDAPVTDSDAARLLAEVGLDNELYDTRFHQQTIERVAQAVRDALETPRPLTHIGLGQAAVQRIASNRRVVLPNGSVTFARGSRSSSDLALSEATEGLIDPNLKSLSFWDHDQPIAVLHSYATHPMSYYGQGEVTSDFVGLARARRQRDDFSIKQLYASGCSGDVTAGKYNDGSHQSRLDLTERLYQAMVGAWEQTRRLPIENMHFRNAQLELPFSQHQQFSTTALSALLHDSTQTTEQRIWAAMGLASRERVKRGQKIDFPCIDFGPAQLLLFPGESFVGYQLMAQHMRPDSFVLSVGYGECWPGYIPTQAAFEDGFEDNWLWVGPGAETSMRKALGELLRVDSPAPQP